MELFFSALMLAMLVSPLICVIGIIILLLSLFIDPIKQNKSLMTAAKVMIIVGGLVFLVAYGGCFFIFSAMSA